LTVQSDGKIVLAGVVRHADNNPRVVAFDMVVVRLEGSSIPFPSNGPIVSNLRRLGFHMRPTRLVLTFNEPLDPASALELANYRLIGPGRDGRLGTHDDHVVPLKRVTYDAKTWQVILRPKHRLPLRDHFELIVDGTPPQGIINVAGTFLNGGAGPGTNYVKIFGREALEVPKRAPRTAPHAAAAPRGTRPRHVRASRPVAQILSRAEGSSAGP